MCFGTIRNPQTSIGGSWCFSLRVWRWATREATWPPEADDWFELRIKSEPGVCSWDRLSTRGVFPWLDEEPWNSENCWHQLNTTCPQLTAWIAQTRSRRLNFAYYLPELINKYLKIDERRMLTWGSCWVGCRLWRGTVRSLWLIPRATSRPDPVVDDTCKIITGDILFSAIKSSSNWSKSNNGFYLIAIGRWLRFRRRYSSDRLTTRFRILARRVWAAALQLLADGRSPGAPLAFQKLRYDRLDCFCRLNDSNSIIKMLLTKIIGRMRFFDIVYNGLHR